MVLTTRRTKYLLLFFFLLFFFFFFFFLALSFFLCLLFITVVASIDELKIANGLQVIPPDFYAWFNSRPDQLADGLHPNGTGYQSMANLWFNALP